MPRLRRFEHHRFVGTRDDMIVYDCDDEHQLTALSARVSEEELMATNGLQTFAPDTVAEARNRGFAPAG